MSLKSFNRWSVPLGLPLVTLMLSKLSLVAPLVSTNCSADLTLMHMGTSITSPIIHFLSLQSTIQAVRFQLLHTPPGIIHFAGDLKYGMINLCLVFSDITFEVNL